MSLLSSDRQSYLWLCFIGIFSLFYYLYYYNYGLNLSDEGYLAYGAKRVLSGQVPGADFHAYMPGRYLILALLFKIFGTNIIVERLMWVFVRVIIAILFFRLAAKVLPSLIALLPTFLVIVMPGAWHKSFETFFPVAWLLSMHFYIMKPEKARIFLLGLSAGTTLFFRLEIGLVVVFLSVVVLGINQFNLWIRKSDNQRHTVLYSFLSDAAVFATVLFLIFLPYLIFLWSRSSVLKSFFFYTHELFAGLSHGTNPFLQPLPSFAQLFASPVKIRIGALVPCFLYFFIFIYVVAVCYLLFEFLKKRWGLNEIFLGVLTCYGIISLYQAISQPDTSHLLQSCPVAYLLTSFIFYQGYRKIIRYEIIVLSSGFINKELINKGLAILFAGCSLIIILLFASDVLRQRDFYYTGSFKIRQDNMAELDPGLARVFVGYEERDEIMEIVNYIIKNSELDDGLMTLIYLPMFNFLSERDNPGFYDIFFPHTTGSATNQEAIIYDIRHKKVKFIVATEGLVNPEKQGLAEQRFRIYGRKIFEFVDNNFHVAYKSGSFVVLQDKDRD